MTDREWPRSWAGPMTTLRVHRPDGSITETVRHDDGGITTTRIGADDEIVARLAIEVQPSGAVTVTEITTDGRSVAVDPSSTESQFNPFGSEVERLEFEGLLSVANTFTDDGELRSVSMRGEWGDQDLEVRPDGARTLAWAGPLQQGTANWDATGRVDHYQVTYPDRTSYRWDLIDGVGRETVVGWDGKTTVRHDVGAPIVDRLSVDERRP